MGLGWLLPSAFAAAAAGLTLGPFGPVSELVSEKNPWHAIADPKTVPDPLLVGARITRIADGDCKAWAQALSSDAPGAAYPPIAAWNPWDEDDRDDLKECDDFPCKVKLDRAETQAMKSAPENKRQSRYFELVATRAARYLKTGERREYEYAGAPVDPWEWFERQGFKSGLPRPEAGELRARQITFDPDHMADVRQILDRRAALAPDGMGATVWVRDVYTSHYFDGWGEWASTTCEGSGGRGVLLVQAVFVELDLLKNHGFFARIAAGRLRKGFEKAANGYLDDWAARVRKRAGTPAH